MRLEFIGNVQILSQDAVVIDLAIDSEGKGAIIVNEGLSASVLKQTRGI